MEKVKLGNVFTISSGGTPNKKNDNYYNGGTIPWIKTGDLKKRYVCDEVEYITEEGLKNSSAKLFPKNTVLVAMYGATIGACSILPYEASTNQACAAFLPNDMILADYLYYFLCSQKEKFIRDGVGGAQPNISAGYLKNVLFPFREISEQNEIVNQLNYATNIIDIRKMQFSKLDELVKSRFIELIVGKGYPVIPVKNLLVQNSTVEKISDTKAEKFVTVGIKGRGARQRVIKDGKWPVPFSGYRVKQGQFIYSRIDARNGAFAILPEEVDNAVVSKDFPVFDIKMDKIQPSFLLFSVLQDDFVRQIQNSSFGATNRQRIQEDVFGEYTITLPPMEVQNTFAAFVKQTDKSKFEIQKSLEKLETLKKALMQKYFG